MASLRGLLALALLTAGCSLRVDYGGTSYRCESGEACPPGFSCLEQRCVREPVASADGGGGGGAIDAPVAPGEDGGEPGDPVDAAPIDAAPADGPVPPPQGTNLLRNPGFEQGTLHWSFKDPAVATFDTVTGGTAGVLAAHYALDGTSDNLQIYQHPLPVLPSRSYRFRMTARSSQGGNVQVVLHQHDAPFAPYGLSQDVDLTTSWQTYTLCFTSSADAANDARLRLWFVGRAAVDEEYYFDELELVDVSTTICIPEY